MTARYISEAEHARLISLVEERHQLIHKIAALKAHWRSPLRLRPVLSLAYKLARLKPLQDRLAELEKEIDSI